MTSLVGHKYPRHDRYKYEYRQRHPKDMKAIFAPEHVKEFKD